jgi:hypothetical protein
VPVSDVKILSTGLAAGIIIDATVIRGVLARPGRPARPGQLVAAPPGRPAAARHPAHRQDGSRLTRPARQRPTRIPPVTPPARTEPGLAGQLRDQDTVRLNALIDREFEYCTT